MTTAEIEDLFAKAMAKRGIHKEFGATKAVVFNYRHGRGNTTLGTKIEVLLKLNLITIIPNVIKNPAE